MPKAMERALQAEARKKFPRDKARQNRYIYGAMRARGWKPKQPHKENT